MKLNTFCKRAACLLLAVICALSLTLPALAAGDKNISNAAKGVVRLLIMDPVTNHGVRHRQGRRSAAVFCDEQARGQL